MDFPVGQLVPIVLPIIAIIAVFTFMALASWAEARRREREAYYRHETYRKLLEQQGTSSQAVLDLLRQEEEMRARRRIEGLKLGGMITTAAGVGISILLYVVEPHEAHFVVGVIPLLIGAVLLIYSFVIASAPPRTGGS